MTTRSGLRAVATGIAAALVLAGCGGSGKDGGDRQAEATATPSATATATAAAAAAAQPPVALEFSIDDAATGPAPAVPGAVAGGTITVLELDDVAHLDPARIYVSYYHNVSNLITRTLTGYRHSGGKVTLVGDLATDTGRTTDGGKTWTFTLRDGITYEDGSKILAKDIKYGLERAFVKDYSEGPTYIQEWLANSTDFRTVYDGPYGGKHLDAISAPDDKTLVFQFEKPHADMPFAAAQPVCSPVKESEDTKTAYDLDPFATGPYKVEEHKPDKSLTLVRNENWKPETDPIHYQYPERYEFAFGTQPLQINQRLIAARDADATAMTSVVNISPEVLEQVTSTPELTARTVEGLIPFTTYYVINNKRVTDLEVRKALLFAFPKEQIRRITGGAASGEFATTISSPLLVGHESFDLFGVPPAGDPERAKATLEKAGKLGQKIVYAYPRTDRTEQVAVALVEGLERGGFEIVKKPLDSKTFIDEVGKVDNPYDLFGLGWGADWPSGSTVYPPTLDGRRIADGQPNFDHFDDPAVNAEMDRISAITDPIEAGREWAALDRTIMAQVPHVPYLYRRDHQIFGPRIGGAFIDPIVGLISLDGLYVKP